MRILAPVVALSVLAVSAFAASPSSLGPIVMAVNRPEKEAIDVVGPAFQSTNPLVRTAAARVALVRGLTSTTDEIRRALAAENDGTAAREEIRALAMLEATPDLDFLFAQAKRFPAGIDGALAYAIARRGPEAATSLFLRRDSLRVKVSWAMFFRSALWTHRDRVTAVAAHVLGQGDERAWNAVLNVAREAAVAVEPAVLLAAMRSDMEPLRVGTVWYLAHGYAADGSQFPELLKSSLAADSSDALSLRESFGRELLRRIAGMDRREDPHWLDWLATKEADDLLENDQDLDLMLSDAEFVVREKRCKDIPLQCVMPKRDGRRIPSKAVLQPEFNLPSLLPAGIADAVVGTTGCRQGWLAVGSATVDSAGRVQKLDFKELGSSPCVSAMETIVRLSLATNERMTSPLRTENLLLVRGAGAPVCLDEDPPGAVAVSESAVRVGGDVRAPVVAKRVEPDFPESARRSMEGASSVMVIVQATISRTGCVRNVRLLSQSPFPELNAAALVAMSKWTFKPGLLDGQPVDVLFNLTINFRLR